jgi:hypothetical protein
MSGPDFAWARMCFTGKSRLASEQIFSAMPRGSILSDQRFFATENAMGFRLRLHDADPS